MDVTLCSLVFGVSALRVVLLLKWLIKALNLLVLRFEPARDSLPSPYSSSSSLSSIFS